MVTDLTQPITDQEIIAHKLEADDWSLETQCINEGGLYKQTTWEVTIRHSNQSYTVSFYNGQRRWKRKPFAALWEGGYTWLDHMRPGKLVQWNLPHLKSPEKCLPHQRDSQQQAFDEFVQLTTPVPPTLDDVMHSLYLDATSVRFGQTFENWCDDFGVSTDSRKALASYEDCRNAWSALVRLNANFDTLEELFQE